MEYVCYVVLNCGNYCCVDNCYYDDCFCYFGMFVIDGIECFGINGCLVGVK